MCQTLKCHKCGIEEHETLIDATWPEGQDENGDYTVLLCIKCYPLDRGWLPVVGPTDIMRSIRPELKKYYDSWIAGTLHELYYYN